MSPEIHIWQLQLDDAGWDKHLGVLSPTEYARFERIRVEQTAHRHRRCRIALRLLLAVRLGRDAASLPLGSGRFGKPYLEDDTLEFSVSHSGGRGLIAIATESLGIDIEWMGKGLQNIGGLLQTVCHEEEKQAAYDCVPAQRREFFFRLWTAKEAYCKAIGAGLYRSMDDFCVRESDGLRYVADPDGEADYYLVDLSCGTGWSASLCSTRPNPPLLIRSSVPDELGGESWKG